MDAKRLLFHLMAGTVYQQDNKVDVSLLLRGNGSNGSTSIIDSSIRTKTITPHGNLQISTASYPHGSSSILSDNSADWASWPQHTDFDFGTGDFTVELWLKHNAGAGSNAGDRVIQSRDGDVVPGFYLSYDTNTRLLFHSALNTTGFYGAGFYINISTSNWQHIAICRKGNLFHFWLDGVYLGSYVTVGSLYYNAADTWVMSGQTTPDRTAAQYIKDLRIMKGVSEYTPYLTYDAARICPDTSAGDSNFSSVVLLLHGEGTEGSTTFTDSSGTPHTMTANGNARIRAVDSVFGTSSMYFDGTGDYLTTPYSADWDLPANFTIEFWVKFQGYSASYAGAYGAGILSRYDGAVAVDRGWQVRINGTATAYNSLNIYTGRTDLNLAITSLPLYKWHHVAVSRDGSTIKCFVNGVLEGTLTTSDPFTRSISSAPNHLRVGALYDPTYFFYLNGYLEDVRITKGVARYSAAFSPVTTGSNFTPPGAF